jgi:transferase CAF17, mitochondrial
MLLLPRIIQQRVASRCMSTVSTLLENRGIIDIKGADARKLLQGLVTNDVAKLQNVNDCQATAFLTAKGRVLGDGLLSLSGTDQFLLDCPASVVRNLVRHLTMYKLRSKATIKDRSADFNVAVGGVASTQSSETSNALASLQQLDGAAAVYADPRWQGLGVRAVLPKTTAWQGLSCCEAVSSEHYNTLRYAHGVPEGSDLVERTPLECNLELLNHICFTKGCYVGQELTARTHFKGVVRKRLLPVLLLPAADATAAAPILSFQEAVKLIDDSSTQAVQTGAEIVDSAQEGLKVGQLVAVGAHNVGLAMVRLDAMLSGADMHCTIAQQPTDSSSNDTVCIRPIEPPWWPTNLDLASGKVPL